MRTAATNAAQVLGVADQLGTLERGKFADIVAVSANTLEDIRTLEQVRFVMKGGQIVKPISAPAAN